MTNLTNPSADFKAGGDATATATGSQEAYSGGDLSQYADPFGVGNPSIQSDEDIVGQAQSTKAGALGGFGGSDNVNQNINV